MMDAGRLLFIVVKPISITVSVLNGRMANVERTLQQHTETLAHHSEMLAAIQQSLAHLTEMFTAFQQQQQQPAGHN
jgi:uncharacterized coiled-coil protein SlyX